MIHDPPLGFIVNVVYETMVRIGVSPPEMKWGETWESIILPEGYTKPTKEEFEVKFQEIIREYSFKEFPPRTQQTPRRGGLGHPQGVFNGYTRLRRMGDVHADPPRPSR